MLRVMIIDDEPLAHEVLIHHLSGQKEFIIVKQCFHAIEALAWLAKNNVDLIFLDINMPQLSGIDMLRVLANPPQVIIVSAYQEYALEGFELNVTDYLLKPVTKARLYQAIEKVKQRTVTISAASALEEFIFLKVDRSLTKFRVSDITLIEAYGNYVKLWQAGSETLVTSTLKKILEQLPSERFIQVHKSYVVNIESINTFNTGELILTNQRSVKVGNSYKNAIGAWGSKVKNI